jgi:hypothetical protein
MGDINNVFVVEGGEGDIVTIESLREHYQLGSSLRGEYRLYPYFFHPVSTILEAKSKNPQNPYP